MSAFLIHADVTDGRLHVDAPSGFHAASGLHALDIPLEHVTAAEVVEHPGDAIKGFRQGLGFALPDEHMGKYHYEGLVDYVAARNTGEGVIITLADEDFARLILSVENPAALAASLTATSA